MAAPGAREQYNLHARARYVPTGRRRGAPKLQPGVCSTPGCTHAPLARSLCYRHYRAARRAEGVPWASEGNRRYRARARRWGVPYEPINRLHIFERDGWVCGICEEPVDRALEYPHPRSVSLDHIVPMSRGGGHLRRNVQCSHLACNIAKSDALAA